MVCQKCGNQLNEGAVFCPKCGASVSSENTVSNANTAKKGMNKKWITIGLIAFVVVVAIILINAIGNSDPLKAVKKRLDGTWTASFDNGDFECRLHFSNTGKDGSAILINHAQNDKYFEVVYTGRTNFNADPGSIYLENTSNRSNSEHDDEDDVIVINYNYDESSKNLSLESTFLADYLNNYPKLVFTKSPEDNYMRNLGERVYNFVDFYIINYE